MLSYYVVWSLRRAWSPYLFCDETLDQTRAKHNPVITATPSEHVANKKSKNAKVKLKIKSTDNNTKTQEGKHQVESFQTLLSNLATICKNDCQTAKDHTIVFNTTTIPTPFQETLLNQLKNIADNLNTPQ